MEMPLRRERASVEDYSTSEPDEPVLRRLRRPSVRVNFTGGLIPSTLWGRIAAAGGLIVLLGGAIASAMATHSFILHDPHFIIPDSSAIEIAGNSHLSRAQLLSVFGGDVERNIFRIPLDDRRAQLESLPWIEHATIERLLPDHIRIAIQERTPVAFVRQGGHIGLVDANGVLLDFTSADGVADKPENYSFPVVLGISQSDPLSTRAARMHIYSEFVTDLDSTGENISTKLSEIDLSDPEDIRALVPDPVAGSEVLVHFGNDHFLDRYHSFQNHLAEWRQQYPHLASVDMRYDQQVVLDMQPGFTAPAASDSPAPATNSVAAQKSAAPPAPVHAAPRKSAVVPKAKLKPATHAVAKSAPEKTPVSRTAKKHVGAAQ